ncbi:MAG: pilus assembly protein PilM [Nitrospirales bacterium]|nr:pilus assembly protein PilM [Nitrospirales bacterium]
MSRMGRVLFFSLADDSIAPKKRLIASLDRKGISVVYGRRLLSAISVRAVKTVPSHDYPSPEEFASNVEIAVREIGAAGVPVGIVIPKAWTVIKTFSLPASVRPNISDVVSYEMDRITPFNADESLYDFEVLGEEEGELRILMVAAKAELVNPYLDALRDRGISAEGVTSSVIGIESLFQREGWDDLIFLDLSGSEYSGVVFSGGEVTASFSRLLSGDDNAKADQLVFELEERYRKLGDQAKILVAIEDQSSPLAERLKGLRNLTFVSGSDSGFGPSAQDASYSALGSLVEGLWPKARNLNLLTKGYRVTSRPPLFLTGLLALAGVSMAVAYTIMPMQIETKRLEEITRQIEIRKPGLKKVEALKKEIEKASGELAIIKGFKPKGPLSLDVLKELTAIVPKQAWLTRIQAIEGAIQVEGYAKVATELLAKIEASPLFKKAEFALPTVRDESMKTERFAIKMELEVRPANEKK